jgi:hypothetical protein
MLHTLYVSLFGKKTKQATGENMEITKIEEISQHAYFYAKAKTMGITKCAQFAGRVDSSELCAYTVAYPDTLFVVGKKYVDGRSEDDDQDVVYTVVAAGKREMWKFGAGQNCL